MAGNIKGITIEFKGDTTKLQKALRDVRKESRDVQKELKQIDTGLKFNPTNVNLWRQKQQALKETIKQTEKNLAELKHAQDSLDAQGVDRTSEEYRELEREIIKTEDRLKTFKAELKTIQSPELKALSEKFKQVGTKMQEVGKEMISTGKTLSTHVTAPIVGIGAAAVKVTSDFDTSMSQVQAISGATGDQLEALRSKAREMGTTTKFSAAESADAMYYMALAGWKTEDMLQGLDGIMNLAAAGGSDLATTSDIVTDSLTAFGMSAQRPVTLRMCLL